LSRDECWYISGPMTGLPDFNYPAFEAAEEALQLRGLNVKSPHRIPHPEDDLLKTWEYFMREALKIQLECTHQLMLPGWDKSKGGRREFDIALDLCMPVWMLCLDGSMTKITGILSG
jgi:hypothetical protein